VENILRELDRQRKPPNLILEWKSLHDASKNNILDAGEDARIELNIRNDGKSSALEISLVVSINDNEDITIQKLVNIGTLKAGNNKSIQIPLSASYQVGNSQRVLSIKAKEKSGFDSNSVDIFFKTASHKPELISLSQFRITDFTNDARIEPMEITIFSVTVSNTGEGVSQELNATIELGENVFFGADSTNLISIGKLYPGEESLLEFSFLTINRFKNKQVIPISLKI